MRYDARYFLPLIFFQSEIFPCLYLKSSTVIFCKNMLRNCHICILLVLYTLFILKTDFYAEGAEKNESKNV